MEIQLISGRHEEEKLTSRLKSKAGQCKGIKGKTAMNTTTHILKKKEAKKKKTLVKNITYKLKSLKAHRKEKQPLSSAVHTFF